MSRIRWLLLVLCWLAWPLAAKAEEGPASLADGLYIPWSVLAWLALLVGLFVVCSVAWIAWKLSDYDRRSRYHRCPRHHVSAPPQGVGFHACDQS